MRARMNEQGADGIGGRLRPAFLTLVLAVTVTCGGIARADFGIPFIPFGATKIIFETNATDEDLGIQVSLDGEPWRWIKVISPDGRWQRILQVNGGGELRQLGLTEMFFESNEPSYDEVPPEEILAMFPEGFYRFLGLSVEGDLMVGLAELTHDIPDGPEILTPEEGSVVDPEELVVSWLPVTTPAGIEIVGYQVIVVQEEGSHREILLDLPAEVTSVQIPPEFLEYDTEYSFEVLAIELSGNQTITESSFETEEE